MSDPPLPPSYPSYPSAPPPPPPPSYGAAPPPPPYGSTPIPPTGFPPGYPPAAPGYGYSAPGQNPNGNLAGFWIRFWGRFLDGLLYGLVMLPLLGGGIAAVALSLRDCDTRERFDGTTEIDCGPGQLKGGLLAAGIVLLVIGLVLAIYLYLRHLATTGQTWGRRIAGIKVVDATTGGPPGWGKAIGRSLFEGTISGWVCYLGFLWMLWDSKRQTWHDKVANTLVIKV